MQKLAVVLDDKGYKKSADTIDSFRFRPLELQIVSQTTLEKDPIYERPGENQQGAETKKSRIRGVPK